MRPPQVITIPDDDDDDDGRHDALADLVAQRQASIRRSYRSRSSSAAAGKGPATKAKAGGRLAESRRRWRKSGGSAADTSAAAGPPAPAALAGGRGHNSNSNAAAARFIAAASSSAPVSVDLSSSDDDAEGEEEQLEQLAALARQQSALIESLCEANAAMEAERRRVDLERDRVAEECRWMEEQLRVSRKEQLGATDGRGANKAEEPRGSSSSSSWVEAQRRADGERARVVEECRRLDARLRQKKKKGRDGGSGSSSSRGSTGGSGNERQQGPPPPPRSPSSTPPGPVVSLRKAASAPRSPAPPRAPDPASPARHSTNSASNVMPSDATTGASTAADYLLQTDVDEAIMPTLELRVADEAANRQSLPQPELQLVESSVSSGESSSNLSLILREENEEKEEGEKNEKQKRSSSGCIKSRQDVEDSSDDPPVFGCAYYLCFGTFEFTGKWRKARPDEPPRSEEEGGKGEEGGVRLLKEEDKEEGQWLDIDTRKTIGALAGGGGGDGNNSGSGSSGDDRPSPPPPADPSPATTTGGSRGSRSSGRGAHKVIGTGSRDWEHVRRLSTDPPGASPATSSSGSRAGRKGMGKGRDGERRDAFARSTTDPPPSTPPPPPPADASPATLLTANAAYDDDSGIVMAHWGDSSPSGDLKGDFVLMPPPKATTAAVDGVRLGGGDVSVQRSAVSSLSGSMMDGTGKRRPPDHQFVLI